MSRHNAGEQVVPYQKLFPYLKETIREIRGSKDRDAENYDSGSLCERVLLNMPAENYTLTVSRPTP